MSAPGNLPSCHQGIIPLWISKYMARTASVTLIFRPGVPRQHPRGGPVVHWAGPAVGVTCLPLGMARDGSCHWVQNIPHGLWQILKAQTWPGGRQWDFVYGWIIFQLRCIYWWLYKSDIFQEKHKAMDSNSGPGQWRSELYSTCSKAFRHQCTSANPVLKLQTAWQTKAKENPL